MIRKTTFVVASALASTFAIAAQAQDNSVTVVLSEELEIVEPCMASQSNIGRVILQNISETMTELDPSTGLSAAPRGQLGRQGERHLALQPAAGRDASRDGIDLRRRRRGAFAGADEVAERLPARSAPSSSAA